MFQISNRRIKIINTNRKIIITVFTVLLRVATVLALLLTPVNAQKINKVKYEGFKCDFTDENVKYENAFFIWFEEDEYKLIGLDDNKVVILKKNLYEFKESYLVKLQLFWGKRNLVLDTRDLKFGNFKIGQCIKYSSYNELINSLFNCKRDTCDHN